MQKSLGLKLLLIVGLALIIWIPITLVSFKIDERQSYRQEAAVKVSRSWTGRQTILSPLLIIPYSRQITVLNKDNDKQRHSKLVTDHLFISASELKSDLISDNSTLNKGIYKIPVYNSEVTLRSLFNSSEISEAMGKTRNLKGFQSFSQAQIVLYLSDMRGINGETSFTLNQQPSPAEVEPGLPLFSGALALEIDLQQFLKKPKIQFNAKFKLKGMDNVSLIAMADNADISLSSNWPHPEFTGANLPSFREISDRGFSARWHSNKYANNNLRDFIHCYQQQQCQQLSGHASGVSFIEPVDIYLQSERSVKYAMLFIGLSFISFFIFEHLKRQAIHPIQYTFVGLAIAMFYLLLVSLAEHLAFHWAYLIAASACSGLLFFYLQFILRSFKSAALFGLMITVLYSLLYVIIQAEDFALLMGSTLVFTILACLMTVTRHIDWYQLNKT